MGLSNHHRALVSNLGEGNWGVGTGTENNLTNSDNTLERDEIYFPPASGGKYVEPVPGDSNAGPMSTLDLSGWGTKSNWMVQVKFNTIGSPPSGTNVAFRVSAVRPTGVEEVVLEVTGSDLSGASNGIAFSYGGHEGEKICGPVSYFIFHLDPDAGTLPGPPVVKNPTYTGTFSIDSFVIGWNEGDMCYGLA